MLRKDRSRRKAETSDAGSGSRTSARTTVSDAGASRSRAKYLTVGVAPHDQVVIDLRQGSDDVLDPGLRPSAQVAGRDVNHLWPIADRTSP